MPSPTLRTVLATAFLALLLAASATSVARAAEPVPHIVIDAGHGGPYSNANANGLREKNVNLSIALSLRKELVARGYRVSMTRTNDRAVTLSNIPTWNWSSASARWFFATDGRGGTQRRLPKDDLQARVDRANRTGADLFISIHNNGAASRSARGTETFASPRDALGKSLSRLVHRQVVKRTGLRDRRARTADFYVLRWTNMPAILVEGAFISSPSDARLLKQASFRRKIALGIAEGVEAWFAGRPFAARTRPVNTDAASSAATAVSNRLYPRGASTVVLARADRWADAPGAPALATSLKAPLLWVGAAGVNATTSAELKRLRPTRVVAIGVDGSFSETLTASVAEAASVTAEAVEVLSAPDRVALSALLAAKMSAAPLREVLVVDETDTASMRAVAPAAAAAKLPVLLTRGGTVTAEAATFLASEATTATRVVMVGPAAQLPKTLSRSLGSTVRITGKDLTTRAGAVNARYYTASKLSPIVADRRYGPEYLTAAVYAARSKRPVVPVAGSVLPDQSRLWVTNRRWIIGSVEVFDARGSIPPLMEHLLRKAIYR